MGIRQRHIVCRKWLLVLGLFAGFRDKQRMKKAQLE